MTGGLVTGGLMTVVSRPRAQSKLSNEKTLTQSPFKRANRGLLHCYYIITLLFDWCINVVIDSTLSSSIEIEIVLFNGSRSNKWGKVKHERHHRDEQ